MHKHAQKSVQETDLTKYWIVGGVLIAGGVFIGLIYFTQRGEQVSAQMPAATQMPAAMPMQMPMRNA